MGKIVKNKKKMNKRKNLFIFFCLFNCFNLSIEKKMKIKIDIKKN